ncbi:subtilisin-like protein [Lactarius quietus]|nr:subtilisin-like protein [Lactarius quietus]
MRYIWLVLFSLAATPFTSLATLLTSRWGDMQSKHAWESIPENWEILSQPPAGSTIDLRIALKPLNENALVEALYKVSSPNHPKHVSLYRSYLSQDQIAELVTPHSDTLELVTSWLKHYGIPTSSVSMTHSGSWLKVTGVPVSLANELLGASYQFYRHVETNDIILRTMNYSLPEVLQDHVATVVPTTYFGLPRKLRETPHIPGGVVPRGMTGRDNGNNSYITPSYLSTLYNSSGYVPNATAKNALGISAYDGYSPSPTDLRMFMGEFFRNGTNASYTVVLVNGGTYNPSQPSDQEDLNVQYAASLTYPTPVIFYSTGGQAPFKSDSSTQTNTNDPYLDWLEYMLDQPNITQTVTSGYAGDEQAVPFDYAKRVCILFAQLGMRGVSLIFPSGNGAIGGFNNGNCMANDGSGKVRFLPTFPASCPWVTTVGGTIGESPEVAANVSGGGFSDFFERPSYQSSAVSAFLKNLGEQYNGLYNATGRGFPDVAAQYYNYATILNGTAVLSDGASGAATSFASMISLLNDFLLSRNEPPLGFLNPWLYGHGQAGLNDITSGSNPGCNTSGFSAIVGWDAVSGLGTPNFGTLQQILTNGPKIKPAE